MRDYKTAHLINNRKVVIRFIKHINIYNDIIK